MTWPKSRVSSAEGRWTSSSSPSSRRRTCTSSERGHVGLQLGQIAPTVGFRLHVVDDRQKFANHERFPAADEVVVDSLDQWVTTADIPATAYVVVLTRGHRQDFDVLRALSSRSFRYVGLIGSRAKVARLTDALIDAGVSARLDQAVARAHRL